MRDCVALEVIEKVNAKQLSIMDRLLEYVKWMKGDGYNFHIMYEMQKIGRENGIQVEEVENPPFVSDWAWFTLEIAGKRYTINL